MNYNAQIKENHPTEKSGDNSLFVYVLRILLSFTLMFAGFYAAAFCNFQGHESGFFFVFAAPLIIFNGDENYEENGF